MEISANTCDYHRELRPASLWRRSRILLGSSRIGHVRFQIFWLRGMAAR